VARKLPFDPSTLGPLTIGLDIGIASVGWAVLSPTRIVDLGVRCFDRAENERGEPLNLNRRTLRTARKRIRRRVQRLTKLRRLMRDAGLIATQDVSLLIAEPNEKRGGNQKSPWALRAKALDEKLSPIDWARVLYHLVKRRGFFAARKSETIDETKDGGKMTQGIKRTAELLGPPEARTYRTLGEMAWKAEEFLDSKRNKAGEYKKSFARTMLRDELKLLFAQQRLYGNPDASVSFEEQIEQLFWFQRPALDAAAMQNLVGHCTFEKGEFRAARAFCLAHKAQQSPN
jgi:CRISPR-associated endonuclease Csn1